jgi:hypothetical protein
MSAQLKKLGNSGSLAAALQEDIVSQDLIAAALCASPEGDHTGS